MSNISSIIERVDRKVPNAISERTKLEWIAELDGKIALNVMLMSYDDAAKLKYSFPEDLEKTPLIPFPYDGLYDQWLEAKIDALNDEWEEYANAMEYYNAHYQDFVHWYIATHHPGSRDGTQ